MRYLKDMWFGNTNSMGMCSLDDSSLWYKQLTRYNIIYVGDYGWLRNNDPRLLVAKDKDLALCLVMRQLNVLT